MKQILKLLAILVICIAVILKLALSIDVDTAAITSVIIVTALVFVWIWYYNCTRRGRMAARAMAIQEARKQRVAREYQESWNRKNRRFIRRDNRRIKREIDDMCNSDGDYYDPGEGEIVRDVYGSPWRKNYMAQDGVYVRFKK